MVFSLPAGQYLYVKVGAKLSIGNQLQINKNWEAVFKDFIAQKHMYVG